MNDQRSLYEQLLSVHQLANAAGHYDAADWIMEQGIKPIQESEEKSKSEHVCTFPCETCASKDPNYLKKHNGAKFLLQTSHCEGTYNNRYKRGGQGLRYSKWKTVSKHATLEEAKQAWTNFKLDGMKRRRVTQAAKVLVNELGRIYERRETPHVGF
jgi:hypothetical protein